MKTHYFTREEAIRIMRRGMIEDLVAKGWDREGIMITEIDPLSDGVNGYEATQGTVEAQLLGALSHGGMETSSD